MRLAYLGTSEFAVTVLRRLAASAFRPALVLTPPDRKQGRGRKLTPPPVALAAAELGLALHQSADVNDPDARAALAAADADCGLVCAFGQLLKPSLLGELELLNVHPSLLPRWRGAAPIERAIMAGDEETGVAIMRVTEGLDSGPVALLARTPIGAGEDFGSLSARLAELGGELSVEALGLREAGRLELSVQEKQGVTYAEKIEPGERRLDPGRPAAELERVVRALSPHVGAYVEPQGGERLGVLRARLAGPEEGGSPEPGELHARGEALLWGTASDALCLEVVRPPGKGDMPAADYLRGHSVPRGGGGDG